METSTINWNKKLESARNATEKVDAAVLKEYESPGAYAASQSLFDEEMKAWKSLENIPDNMLSNSDRERWEHFNTAVIKSVIVKKPYGLR